MKLAFLTASLTCVLTAASGKPVVVTPFFYWYCKETGEHFIDPDGTDALTDHPLQEKGYCYRSKNWWKRELLRVKQANIDAVLPVYWGVPGVEGGWSKVGLKYLVKAWEELSRQGKKPPLVGMFYDTSTLKYNPFHYHVDISTQKGTSFFCNTVIEFFEMISRKMWLRRQGKPCVFLYSAHFRKGENPKIFLELKTRFKKIFDCSPFIVKEISWPYRADSSYAWGGALGLKVYGVASLGPGYDHSAVPGRAPLVVPRQDGLFYRKNWSLLLSLPPERRPEIVSVETWNEFHEGTEVAPSKEYGWKYVRLTAHYASLFKQGRTLPVVGPYAGKDTVLWTVNLARGIVPRRVSDGLFEKARIHGIDCIKATQKRSASAKYLYFDADESFAFRPDGVGCTLNASVFATQPIVLEYDSADLEGSVRCGAFKAAQPLKVTRQSNGWKSLLFKLPDARFTNRSNGADFRFTTTGGVLAVSQVKVQLVRDK